jgi:hypothetical protein
LNHFFIGGFTEKNKTGNIFRIIVFAPLGLQLQN